MDRRLAKMKRQDYEYLFELEEDFWWFAGMREITASLLNPILSRDANRRILDAGCGTGGMLSWLQRYSGSREVTGIDFSATGLQFCRRRGQTELARGSIAEARLPLEERPLPGRNPRWWMCLRRITG